jgi:hypothetical protein
MSRRARARESESGSPVKYQRAPGPRLVRLAEPEITHDDYPRIEPGEYRAYCRSARIYFDPGFRKWVCLLRWDVLDLEGTRTLARIAKWIYVGRKQHCTRRSQFWREYLRANGGPPTRKDRLCSSVFVRRIARVLVRDTMPPAAKRGELPQPYAPYSVVEQILSWETGAALPSTSVLQSHIPVQHR